MEALRGAATWLAGAYGGGGQSSSSSEARRVEGDGEARNGHDFATWGPDDAGIVFTAYFEGTANVVERRTTQIGLFHELDRGVDVGAPASPVVERT